ncbi:hypothetical protein [Roseateles terrae]|uniref:Lipoprotein n=1 Tax=Roseateles terrae TaxID=431060 RepID=A0ABR6GTL6_9BURK|nr:hypothetical protein [Roseateles terrae]MBB3195061.1 hypothetical protein [Roseateles terrae]
MLKSDVFLRTVIVAAALATTSVASWAGCRVATAPEGWAASSMRWDGDCTGDTANGLGVLKEQDGATVKRMFFGRVVKGELTLGVLDEPGQGFGAGEFRGGKLIDTDDRSLIIKSFEDAAKAAAAAADRFERAGNKASAKFYRDKAKQLREQMD